MSNRMTIRIDLPNGRYALLVQRDYIIRDRMQAAGRTDIRIEDLAKPEDLEHVTGADVIIIENEAIVYLEPNNTPIVDLYSKIDQEFNHPENLEAVRFDLSKGGYGLLVPGNMVERFRSQFGRQDEGIPKIDIAEKDDAKIFIIANEYIIHNEDPERPAIIELK